MAFGPYDIRAPYTTQIRILPGGGTSPQTFFVIAEGYAVLVDVLITNSDTIAHVLNLLHSDGSVIRQVGSVNVPARQGYDATPPLYLGASILPPLLQVWGLKPTHQLMMSVNVAMSAGTVLDVIGFGGYV